ncbi:MAG: PPK2 family polyphosphate kinase [Myxococcota bacterium]
MFDAPKHPSRVPFDGSFRIRKAPTRPPDGTPGKKALEQELADVVSDLSKLQERLYADDRVAVLAVFQAMDAAGKDGTIRAVLTGVNPAGCQVYSFKRPSEQELDHDFLWRHLAAAPERGRIGIFNRSWYEEVLVVRVHPELLDRQRLPWRPSGERLWAERLDSIADVERHLARNGTAVVKFFLHVSKDEQRDRFLARIDDPSKHWKFQEGDVAERVHWDAYHAAYEAALNATSKPWAPWYAVPADDKASMRLEVARILRDTLRSLELEVSRTDPAREARLAALRAALVAER